MFHGSSLSRFGASGKPGAVQRGHRVGREYESEAREPRPGSTLPRPLDPTVFGAPLVGDFKNAGREWQPKGRAEKSLVHDFPQDAAGKAIPYGIYDMGRNEAWVSVGCDHDTPAFAAASLRRWWEEMGKSRYPDAHELYITADAGGSNGYRLRAWKHELQRFADETSVRVHVSHFPPGTSKFITPPGLERVQSRGG